MVYRAGQRKGPISPSNLHILGDPVPLPHMCHRVVSIATSSRCQGIHLDYSRNPNANKQPAQQRQVVPRGQQQLRGPQTSYLVVDKQQVGTPRQLHFTISPSKHFNPMSVASVIGEESLRNISGLSGLLYSES